MANEANNAHRTMQSKAKKIMTHGPTQLTGCHGAQLVQQHCMHCRQLDGCIDQAQPSATPPVRSQNTYKHAHSTLNPFELAATLSPLTNLILILGTRAHTPPHSSNPTPLTSLPRSPHTKYMRLRICSLGACMRMALASVPAADGALAPRLRAKSSLKLSRSSKMRPRSATRCA